MENFTYKVPTKLIFGKESQEQLHKELIKNGTKFLLLYGKGSIKNNGIYNDIVNQVNLSGKSFIEYSGIKSNPVVKDVDNAATLARQEGVDAIIAVGGGSVIDSAKILSLCIIENHNAWDIMTYTAKPKQAVPVFAVLTLAATGTEMNPFAVLQNPETKQKIGYGNPLIYPKVSVLNPEYTYSVPKNYTAYGIVDLIAHALEAYFGAGNAPLSDKYISAIIEDAIEYGPKLINNLSNYEYRAEIMFAATCALDGRTALGKVSGDWGVHGIGHILSFLYDMPHGASLSIAYPAWMKYFKNQYSDKIKNIGKRLFNIEDIDKTIAEFEAFFQLIGSPISLNETNISIDKKGEIVSLMKQTKVSGYNQKITNDDYEKIVELMWE